MDWFGLGIMLQAKDNASQSILKVSNSLTALTDNLGKTSSVAKTEIESIQNSLSGLEASFVTGLGMQQFGQSMMNLSGSLISPLKDVANETVKTGAQFEQWRMTLKALYKDADLASEKLQWGMNLAANTPFEVSDVTEALIGFKAMGVEADSILTSTDGITQSMLEFVGDLAALRPDIGLNSVMIGVRNLMGGDGGRSLRARLDLPLEEVLGREFSTDTEGLMQDIADLSSKVAGGLMNELKGTWNQYLSNLQDQKDRFFLAIADSGAFDSMKNTLAYLAEAVDGIDDEKLANIGKNISIAFGSLWKPIDLVAKKLVDLGIFISDLMAQSPMIATFITTFLSLAGGLTAVTGAVLILGGTFIIAVNGLKLFLISLQGLRSSLAFVGSSLKGSMLSMSKFALVGGVIYGLWKSDFGGIRSILQNFMNDIFTAFSYSTEIANMSVGDMMDALSQLDTHTFGGWLTLQLVRLQVLWMGLCDAWNDYTLSDDNFQKLRELGLLPVLETILDFKMKAEAFFEGFKQGWQTVSNVVKTVLTTIGKTIESAITFFFPMKEGIDEINEATEGLNTSKWETFGKVIGIVAGAIVSYKIGSKIWDISSNVLGLGKNILSLPSKVAKGFTAVVDGAETMYIKMLYAKDGVVAFIDKVKNIPTKAIDGVKSAWEGVTRTLSASKQMFSNAINWVKNLSNSTVILTAKTWLQNAAQTALNTVQAIFNAIMAVNPMVWVIGLIVAVTVALVALWVKCEGFREVVISVANAIGEGLMWLWNNVLTPIGQFVGSVFLAYFTYSFNAIKEVITVVGETISGVFDGIKRALGGVIDFVTGVFTGNWQQAWQGVSDIIGGIFDGMVALVKAPINAIIGCINAMIRGINSVNFNVPDWVPAIGGKGLSFNLSEIPKLNTGGYIKDEGISMLHPNEVVINDPLTRKLKAFLEEDSREKRKGVYASVSGVNTTNIDKSDKSTSTEQIDNSVTFSEGAIQVTLTNGSEADVEKLFKEISKRLKREQSLRNTLNYKPSLV